MAARDGGRNVSDRQDVVGAKTRDKDATKASRDARFGTIRADRIVFDTGETLEDAEFDEGTKPENWQSGVIPEEIQIEGNYVPGSSGWAIDGYGNAEFNNLEARGSLIAAQGTVVIADSGIRIEPGTGGANSVSWVDSDTGLTRGNIYATTSALQLSAADGISLDAGGFSNPLSLTGDVNVPGGSLTVGGSGVVVWSDDPLTEWNHDHGTSGWTTSIDWQGGSGSGPNFTSNRNTDEFDTTDTTTGEVGSHNHSVPDHRHWVSL